MTALAKPVREGLDPVLGGLAGALILIGFVAIASASIGYGDWHFNNPWHHTLRHAVYLSIAAGLGAVAYRVPVDVWQRTSGLWLLLALALLLLVLVPGIAINPRQILGDHQVDLAGGDQLFSFADAGPIGQHATAALAEMADGQRVGVDLFQVVFDKPVGGLDVLFVLILGRYSADDQYLERPVGILWTQRNGNLLHD